MNPLPRLPTEIWERIINQINYRFEHPQTETLYACTLVCRSWHIRARLCLYRRFLILSDHIPQLQTTLRNNANLSLSSTTFIRVYCNTKPVSALFAEPTSQNLTSLELASLDLTKEHSLIMRGPLARSVTRLVLWSLHSCTVSSLLRFLKSFHSLTDLDADFSYRHFLLHTGQILPQPHPITSRSLKTLSLQVIPGVGKLIEWYVREGRFLSSLEKLQLLWRNLDECDGGFEAPASLLRQCIDTLEELTLSVYSDINKDSFVNGFSRNGMFRYIHHTTLSHQ